ncbi:MAG: cyclic pyranopterin monophosphate synthase MoaC [Theionarchaea archaeon]|nr:cyclic pyranopterin monophosphate synthase MoaC [Theionarchaea archaeon]
MVNISDKPHTHRVARARGKIFLRGETLSLIQEDAIEKGEVFPASQLAGISAAKKTPGILPLCHQINLDHVAVSFCVEEDGIVCECTSEAAYSTGVEMEALIGVSVALLNIWDMVKQYEKEDGKYPYTRIGDIQVIEKRK